MFSKLQFARGSIVAAAALALTASGVAFADDSSIARLTGDSYAFFNNLDYSLGKFNTERTPRAQDGTLAKTPAKLPPNSDPAMMSSARRDADKSASPIRDDRGG